MRELVDLPGGGVVPLWVAEKLRSVGAIDGPSTSTANTTPTLPRDRLRQG
jgi:hypothetical protein